MSHIEEGEYFDSSQVVTERCDLIGQLVKRWDIFVMSSDVISCCCRGFYLYLAHARESIDQEKNMILRSLKKILEMFSCLTLYMSNDLWNAYLSMCYHFVLLLVISVLIACLSSQHTQIWLKRHLCKHLKKYWMNLWAMVILHYIRIIVCEP